MSIPGNPAVTPNAAQSHAPVSSYGGRSSTKTAKKRVPHRSMTKKGQTVSNFSSQAFFLHVLHIKIGVCTDVRAGCAKTDTLVSRTVPKQSCKSGSVLCRGTDVRAIVSYARQFCSVRSRILAQATCKPTQPMYGCGIGRSILTEFERCARSFHPLGGKSLRFVHTEVHVLLLLLFIGIEFNG